MPRFAPVFISVKLVAALASDIRNTSKISKEIKVKLASQSTF
jgi:hypothetical protein